MKDNQYLMKYEEQLSEVLVDRCTSLGFMDGQMIQVEELDEKWSEIAPDYMIDAVSEVNTYPAAAISWAAYLGMAVAAMWDGAWDEYESRADLYAILREPRGFDAMDEHIVRECLGIEVDSEEGESIAALLLGCAHTAMVLIRNEKFEPQSADAFYVLASTVKVFFRLGVSLELRMLGYEYRKVRADVLDRIS